MGIDIYARWKGQTEQEQEAQYTGFSVVHGHVGYLREGYHGRPYATRVLVPEAFAAANCEAQIAATLLRERLPAALEAARERCVTVYQQEPDSEDSQATLRSFADFVALCERKEAETGEPVTILASY